MEIEKISRGQKMDYFLDLTEMGHAIYQIEELDELVPNMYGTCVFRWKLNELWPLKAKCTLFISVY